MVGFTETKKLYDQGFAELNEHEYRHFRVVSYDTAGGVGRLVIQGGSDLKAGHQAQLVFHEVGYIHLPTDMYWVSFGLAKTADAMPIQRDLGDAAYWVTCIEMSAEGGPPFKYFIAAKQIEFN